MKSPREVILKQHRHSEERLKTIRPEDLAACARESLPEAKPERSAGLGGASVLERFWAEAILPWRRVWLGMATVWVGILVLNAALDGGENSSVTRAVAETDPRVKMVLREQRQFLAQLLEPTSAPRSLKAAPPGPRSDMRVEEVMV